MAFDSALLDVVGSIPFKIYKVATSFNPNSVFSRVDLNLETYEDPLGYCIGVRAEDLFDLEQLELEAKPEHQEVFKFIKNSKSRAWPPILNDLSERSVLLAISQHILVHLCRPNEVVLEKSYSTLISKLGPDATGIRTDYIGLGSWKTWHGTPDARVRGSEVLCRKVLEKDDEAEEVDSDGESTGTCETFQTDGTTSTVEAKLKVTTENMAQVVATCVVSSFTESRCHPDKPAAVPTVLITLKQFQVCLYDCRLDVLLISTPKPLLNNNRLSRSALLFLWLAINHR